MSQGHQQPLPTAETAPKPVAAIETVTIASLVIATLCLLLFAWIANHMSRESMIHFDRSIREQVHQHASAKLTTCMIAISFLGAGGLILTAAATFAVFLYLRWMRAVLWLAIALLGALVLEVTLKYSFGRIRPPSYFVPPLHTPSFPSGHALVSFCFYGVLAGLLGDRIRSARIRILIWLFAAALVAAIGFSRIYLGVHYPSDVIAGYLVAALWVSTMITVDRLRASRKAS
jgi:undecaprenyl-diphosphatase